MRDIIRAMERHITRRDVLNQFTLAAGLGLTTFAITRVLGLQQQANMRSLLTPEIPHPLASQLPSTAFYAELPDSTVKNLGYANRLTALQKVVSPDICQALENNQWGLYLASGEPGDISSFQFAKQLNKQFPQLPIVMWVVGTKDYWTNYTSVAETKTRTEEVLREVNNFNLSIRGLGFDSEPPIQVVSALAQGFVPGLISVLDYISRAKQFPNANAEVNSFFEDLHSKGIPTEAYLSFFPGSLLSPAMEKAARRYSMAYLTTGLPPRYLFGLGLNRNSYPAFGNFSDLKDPSGNIIDSGVDLGAPAQIHSPHTLTRDMTAFATIQKQRGLNTFASMRVFALTGPNIIEAAQKGYEAIGKQQS